MEKEGELLKFKGFYFQSALVDYDILEKLEDFEIRDNDIFVISYPKSGTVWILQILCLIHFEGYRNKTDTRPLNLRAPFLEYNVSHVDLEKTPSPRIIGSHLPYYLVPRGLKNKKAKIIYMCRNPKDVMNSFFHFSNMLKVFQPTNTMEEFMKKFLEGKVMGGLWFDHIRGWYEQKHQFNILFMTYEEMKKDLRSSVLKICTFLEKELTDDVIDSVIQQCLFESMKYNLETSINAVISTFSERRGKTEFIRRGVVGDWKNYMTVEQSERFDKIYQNKMKDFPLKFIWNINEEFQTKA